jgi:hypothetical protein
MARRLAVIFSLAWLAFCVLVALGLAERLCATSGCELYGEWTLWGVSLWWWGAGAFALLAVAALASAPAALALAGFIVLLDAGLLAAMTFMAPCTNCLIAGGGFFLVWLCLLWAVRPKGSATLLAVLWVATLSPNLVALAGDGGGWAIYGDTENAATRVYFSPSCPACRRAVFTLGALSPSGVAYIPVSEVPQDVDRLISLHQDILAGAPFLEAFRRAVAPDFQPGDHGFWRRLRYRALLAHNHAVFRRMGGSAVPYVATVGLRPLPGLSGPVPLLQPPGEPRPAPVPAPAPDAAPEQPASAPDGTSAPEAAPDGTSAPEAAPDGTSAPEASPAVP